MEIFNPHSQINFLGARKFSMGLALVLVVASLLLIFTKGLNYGLEFTGGVSIEVSYQQPVAVAEVRQGLLAHGFEAPVVQSLGGSREVSIRLQPQDDPGLPGGKISAAAQADRVASDVMAALRASRADARLGQRNFTGPQVGKELRSDGSVAALFVMLGIGVYLWIRFERRFAIAALVTEVHDVILTLGLIALFGRQFDLTVLASVLAVIGYSINDKVVVFDRIRELFRSTRKAEPVEVLNRSINSTLSRTIITSLFTGIAMAALYCFGGPEVHGFAVTMLIGIVVGTLSSIFISSPILLWLGVSKQDLMPKSKEHPELERRP